MHIIKVGDKDIKFVRVGGEVVYPSYIKDGLVLWYDFSGRGNTDTQKGIAEDLSGNGNDGVLNNFAYDAGSGYADNGLEFDGVDDGIIKEATPDEFDFDDITVTSVFKSNVDIPPHITNLVNKGSWNQDANLALGFRVGGMIVFFYGSRDFVRYPINSVEIKETNVITGVAKGDTQEMYINGVLVDSRQIERVPVINNFNLTVGMASYFSSGYVDGNIYSTRIYNRALTPEEISHNYKIDKHRFNIQD